MKNLNMQDCWPDWLDLHWEKQHASLGQNRHPQIECVPFLSTVVLAAPDFCLHGSFQDQNILWTEGSHWQQKCFDQPCDAASFCQISALGFRRGVENLAGTKHRGTVWRGPRCGWCNGRGHVLIDRPRYPYHTFREGAGGEGRGGGT